MGLVAVAAPHAQAATPDSEKPNILFILCDDMGYGDLGCYGQPFIQTPCIDQMAQEGMRFTQAYAGSPVSAPSRATIMTGQHSGHGHVRGNKEYWLGEVWYGQNKEYAVTGQEPYDPQHIILPEIMKKNGYTTGMFGKWAGGYEGTTNGRWGYCFLISRAMSKVSLLSEPGIQMTRSNMVLRNCSQVSSAVETCVKRGG